MSDVAVYCGKKNDRLVNVVLESERKASLVLRLVNSSRWPQICVVYLERGVMEPIELERTFIEANTEKLTEIKGITPADIRNENSEKIRIAFIPLQNKTEKNEANNQNTPICHGGKYQVSKFIAPIPENYRTIGREEFPISMLRIEEGYSSEQSLLMNRCPRSAALTDIQNKWTLGFHSTSVDMPVVSIPQKPAVDEAAEHAKLGEQNSENQPATSEQRLPNKTGLDALVKSQNAVGSLQLARRNNAFLCQAHRRHVDKRYNVVESSPRDMVGEVADYLWSFLVNVVILLICYLAVKVFTC